jgi:AcrR family transcriptional regulator
MSNSFTSGPPGDDGGRKSYHHGNLKDALIRAALDLISQKGAAGFTFAEAARQAGVSPAAPYRHYRDRDMLMADVAKRGFELFASRLEKAWNAGNPQPLEALQRMGKAYLTFAREQPAHYAAMFESGLPLGDYPECRSASDAAFEPLKKACEVVISSMKNGARPPAMMMALHIWSVSHGVASLFARGDEARQSIPMAAEELLESAILIYLDGLGIDRRAPAKR